MPWCVGLIVVMFVMIAWCGCLDFVVLLLVWIVCLFCGWFWCLLCWLLFWLLVLVSCVWVNFWCLTCCVLFCFWILVLSTWCWSIWWMFGFDSVALAWFVVCGCLVLGLLGCLDVLGIWLTRFSVRFVIGNRLVVSLLCGYCCGWFVVITGCLTFGYFDLVDLLLTFDLVWPFWCGFGVWFVVWCLLFCWWFECVWL